MMPKERSLKALRDQMAKAAMQAFITSATKRPCREEDEGKTRAQIIAEDSYFMADEMMKARVRK